VVSDHLVETPPRLRRHRSLIRLALTVPEVHAATKLAAGRTLVIGMGLGEIVGATLAQGLSVTVWERDPAVMRAALERTDFSEAIGSRALRLRLGVDLVELSTQAFRSVVVHPVLGQIYSREMRLLEAGLGPRRALVCAGGLFVDDVADGLEGEGFSVYIWDIHRLSSQDLDEVVARFDPEVIFAINHTHGLADACRRFGRPLIVWEIDPSTDQMRRCERSTESVRICTYREANIPHFEAAGFRHVAYVPLAANTDRRCPGVVATDVPAAGKLCFVGASMVDQAQHFRGLFQQAWVAHGGDAAAGVARLEQVLAAQRRLGGSFQIPALVQAAMGDFVAAARSSLDHDLVAMISEMAAAERRLNVVARLGRCGIHIWGDPGWKAVEPHGARYMGFAGHDQALTEIYRAGAIHVDVARLYQQDIVPMRIFDILACGGFVIAEHSPALTALFKPGRDLETWGTPEELEAKVRHYQAHPDQAQAMARSGMQLVHTHHTIRARVREMLRAIDIPLRITG
jgi:spore maturation protein CgeB